ncbi:MAG: RDD family protein [Acidobacteriaceae bacterium]|nr:RDD family protein [Acidobacteriaceae bacterium]
MDWYYAVAGERVGPIPDADFRALCATGHIGPENLVWRPGMPDWQPLGLLQNSAAPSTPAPDLCTECGRRFRPEDLLPFQSARVCAACKDTFFQRLREQGAASAVLTLHRYAGFWIRVLARVIDSAILWAFFLALLFVWEALVQRVILNPANATPSDLATVVGGLGLIYLLSTAVLLLYESWFLYRRGGTPGKLAVGVRVIRGNSEPLTLGRSAGRAFAYLLTSMVPIGIGFIMAGADDEKRALHDRLCDTRVVYKS